MRRNPGPDRPAEKALHRRCSKPGPALTEPGLVGSLARPTRAVVAPIAFGVNVKCAQCHGHPLAPEIEQRHYWGIVAAFNRSKNVDTPNGPGIAESAIGGFVSFANLKKESQPALVSGSD